MALPTGMESRKPCFAVSAWWLVGCVLVVALLLLPFARGNVGSGSPAGVLIAGAICLSAAMASEVLGCFAIPSGSPMAAVILGMGIRMLPPLGICFVLAARGESGHQHLAFVVYLLAFYLVTLVVETSLAVKRLAKPASNTRTTVF